MIWVSWVSIGGISDSQCGCVCVNVQLSRDCKVEVQRILHQRALDVKLDPELQKRCMTDLGKWCSEKTDTGQVRHTHTHTHSQDRHYLPGH